MELGLSLGETRKPLSALIQTHTNKLETGGGGGVLFGFCKAAAAGGKSSSDERKRIRISEPPILQLNLLPSQPSPLLQIPWLQDAAAVDDTTTTDEGATLSSPNSAMSSFQMHNAKRKKRVLDGGGSDADDEEENGSTRKKLRLSKEQSAFLEETFKEHTSLNPKQKLALAKQLNLRPRQVEVWFQNRRARTKLKQTEVDCEYLKRCCESLTEENRRLQKKLQELRALKTCEPFYMQQQQAPATTLTMCPSCERVATNTTGNQTTSVNNDNNGSQVSAALSLAKPTVLPLLNGQAHLQQAREIAS